MIALLKIAYKAFIWKKLKKVFLIVPSLFENKKSKDNKKETEGSASEEQATGLYL
ncbi:hypothetical protein H7U05_04755 [Priestia megaterium]|nr:hypothetical protein [Priestia megaterium]